MHKLNGGGTLERRYAMELSKPPLFIFLLLFMSLFSTAGPAKPPSEADVVKVGALDQEKPKGFDLDSASFADLNRFYQANYRSQPDLTLSYFQHFLFNRADLSAAELMELYLAVSNLHSVKGDHSEALKIIEKALLLLPKLPLTAQTDYRMTLTNRVAQLYRLSGNYPMAISTTIEGFEQAKSARAHYVALSFALRLSYDYLDLKRPEDATHWLDVARRYVGEYGDVALNVWFLFEKAKWHRKNAELYLSQETIKRAIKLSEENDLASLYLQARLQLAMTYRLQKKFMLAEPLLQAMFELAQESRNRSAQFYILREIVESELSQQRYAKAAEYWRAMNDMFRYVSVELEEKRQLRQAIEGLSVEILIGQEQFNKALRKLNRLVSITPSDNWLLSKLRLEVQLNQVDNALQSLSKYKAQLTLAREARLGAQLGYEIYRQQQKNIELERDMAELKARTRQTEYELADTRIKSQWLIIVVVILLNVICVYYIWRQYGGLWRNRNIYIDPLTQLPNYRAMCETGYEMIAKNEPFSLILFGMDDFSKINKRLGYRQADAILGQLSSRLAAMLRQPCILSRYQGDCFVVLAPGFDQTQGFILAERLRIELNIIGAQIQSNYIELSASFAVTDSDGDHPLQSLLENAQQALDYIKSSGKNRTAQG